VKRDFICLYCNDRCQPFSSLEAVRKHMDAKGHCKLRYGDGGDDEDADLEDFYDYSSRFVKLNSMLLSLLFLNGRCLFLFFSKHHGKVSEIKGF
jgi:pre-60S factor REI1